MRDYCPSRKEQAKLKRKKTQPAKRASQKSRSSTKKKKNKQQLFWQRVLLVLAILLAFSVLFFSLRQQWREHLALSHECRILLTQENRPRAMIILQPQEETIQVFDFDQATTRIWPEEDQELEATFSNSFRKKLFYSYAFSQIVDHEFTYTGALEKDELSIFFKDNFKSFYFRDHFNFLLDRSLTWKLERLSEDNLIETLNLHPREKSKIFECPVAVINTTNESGLAQNFSELLEKASFSVIRRDNQELNLAETELVYDPEMTACEPLLKEAEKLLPKENIKANHQVAQENRVGLVIFLGDDLAALNLFFVDLFHGNL